MRSPDCIAKPIIVSGALLSGAALAASENIIALAVGAVLLFIAGVLCATWLR